MMISPKVDWYLVVGWAYVSMWAGIGIATVGRTPKCDGTPYSWVIAFTLPATVALPFILGYLGGRGKEDG